MTEKFRTFCESLRKDKDIRILCSDWTALEYEVEEYVNKVADLDENAILERLEVQDA
jgi:hypothetical protein